MAFLKLVELGVPKEKMGLLAVPLSPLNMLLPFIISRLLNGNSPFKYLKSAILFRLIIIAVTACFVYLTPIFILDNKEFPFSFYAVILIIEAFHSVAVYSSFMPVTFFFSQISDKNFGGTYLTFLNTISNLARNWVGTGSLYLANYLSTKYCDFKPTIEQSNNSTELASLLEQSTNCFCSSETESKVNRIYSF